MVLKKRKILSIDDSSTARLMIKNGVDATVYELLEAGDGQEGLNVLAQSYQEIALILLDWSMPGMNGLEFLSIVKNDRRYRDIPVMVVTTESEKDSIIKAIKLGAVNYLLKPFDKEELRRKITACLTIK